MTDLPLRDMVRERLRFAVGGGLAVESYVPQRLADDVDLFFATRDGLKVAVRILLAHGIQVEEIEEEHQYAASGMLDGELVAIDLHLALPGAERAAVSRARLKRVRGMLLPVPALDDLIVMKMEAGRRKDLDDVVLLEGVA